MLEFTVRGCALWRPLIFTPIESSIKITSPYYFSQWINFNIDDRFLTQYHYYNNAKELTFHIYRVSGSSSIESAMLHRHVSAVAQNGQRQTKHCL